MSTVPVHTAGRAPGGEGLSYNFLHFHFIFSAFHFPCIWTSTIHSIQLLGGHVMREIEMEEILCITLSCTRIVYIFSFSLV